MFFLANPFQQNNFFIKECPANTPYRTNQVSLIGARKGAKMWQLLPRGKSAARLSTIQTPAFLLHQLQATISNSSTDHGLDEFDVQFTSRLSRAFMNCSIGMSE